MSFLDLTDIETEEFKPIKPGKYLVSAIDAKVEDNSKKTGTKLVVKFKIMSGEDKGKELSSMFNITHISKDAQRIGLSQLKSMLHAMGKGDILEKLSDILGSKVMANVKNENYEGKIYSKINYFEPAEKHNEEDSLPF